MIPALCFNKNKKNSCCFIILASVFVYTGEYVVERSITSQIESSLYYQGMDTQEELNLQLKLFLTKKGT